MIRGLKNGLTRWNKMQPSCCQLPLYLLCIVERLIFTAGERHCKNIDQKETRGFTEINSDKPYLFKTDRTTRFYRITTGTGSLYTRLSNMQLLKQDLPLNEQDKENVKTTLTQLVREWSHEVG
jgi:hypothetical protein